MLFPYELISHDVEKLHKFISHTVLEVWGKAKGSFDITELDADFQPIVESIGKNKKDYLKKPIVEIYDIFASLSKRDRKYIIQAFEVNNNIKGLCEGKVTPVFYEDIAKIHVILAEKLKKFCEDLYKHVISNGVFCKTYKSINDFYREFVRVNSKGKCPFCGLADIKSELLSKRDAFDHYFPKAKIPFNSINVENLAPACATCNTSYKQAAVPSLNKKGKKRKSFFPYSDKHSVPKIKIKINSLDPIDPKKNDIKIEITSLTLQEEVDTWMEMYGIEERYNDKCCSPDSKLWLQLIIDDSQNYGIDPKIVYKNCKRNRKNNPWEGYNFLRIPFLDGCNRIKLFGR